MRLLNILIVDDCPVMRLMIRKTISLCEIEVDKLIEAGDGSEGLKWVRNMNFDLVIADLNMPVMSGSEMIAQLRINPANDDVSILAVSAESNENRVKVVSAFTQGYVHKPFSAEQLRDEILKIL